MLNNASKNNGLSLKASLFNALRFINEFTFINSSAFLLMALILLVLALSLY